MKERPYTVFYMMVVCVIATLMLTGSKLAFRNKIERNQEVRMQRAILSGLGILPESPTIASIQETYRNRVATDVRDGMTFYYAYDSEGNAVERIGFVFDGQAFWGRIRGLLAVEPDLTTVAGFEVIEQNETPGLGARIAEPAYKASFKGKKIGKEIADGQYLELVAADVEEPGPQQIQAITGATRTSDSLRQILNDSIETFRKIAETNDLIATAPKPGGG